ncbi:MAG: pyruvate dehydrogenase complex dihydrolipoamide acetyltransferase [Verrucomicrobiota bacterium]
MPIVIEMPKLSDTMTEGTVLRWMKKEGESVEVGDVLAEIETDKATMEMEAFDDGVIHQIFVSDGAKVPVGERLALLLEEDEEPPSGDAAASAPTPAEIPANSDLVIELGGGTTTSSEAAPPPEPAAASSAAAPTPSGQPDARIKASPLARKIAAEKGMDLATLTGSGPGGRIVKADVVGCSAGGSVGTTASAAGAAATAGLAASAGAAPVIRPVVNEGDERVPLSSMRTIIAQRLTQSKTQIPHFYLTIEVNAGPLMKLRKEANESAEKEEGGNKYTVNDFILRAAVAATRTVPAVNASFDGDAIVHFASVNISVAIAVEDGLVTPVIRDSQEKSLLEMSLAVKDLALRARQKKLKPSEFDGGTLTVSNLGAYGIDSFDAIINPPQAAILSVGTIAKKPVVLDSGELGVGLRMKVGMSCDHRVIDGAVAAQYLAELKRLLENPALMLL